MRKVTLVFLFFSVFFAAPMVVQNYQLKFDIVNNTGVDLFGVYVSDVHSDGWGDDIIPYDIFESGTYGNCHHSN